MNNYRISSNGHLHIASAPCGDDSCAPVVVISPEDREQIMRLQDALHKFGIILASSLHEDLVAALREFAAPTPPRPEEPLGLGAVVEDAAGVHYVRHCYGTCEDGTGCIPWSRNEWGTKHHTYDEIAATRVLSPGYTEGGAS